MDTASWSTYFKASRGSALPFPSPRGLAGPLPSALRPASRHGPAPGLSPALLPAPAFIAPAVALEEQELGCWQWLLLAFSVLI